MIPTFTKSYLAAAVVLGRSIVAYAAPAADNSVETAATATVVGLGIADTLGAEAGQMLDVHRAGLAEVELGGPVSAGDPLMADANGKAIEAVAAAGTSVWFVGYADGPGVAGDFIDCFVAPGVIHEA